VSPCDFTRALYLGMRHPWRSLPPWDAFTTGAPDALRPVPGAPGIAAELAGLQGCAEGVLAPSTLHLFWDLFVVLGPERTALFLDDGSYAVARWGVERAAARGASVHRFAHHDTGALRRALARHGGAGRTPVVVADGWSPLAGGAAPLAEYRAAVREHGGLLVLDDTQALGVLGARPSPAGPWGAGGGGSLPWSGTAGDDVLAASSLAKGFGVPVAVLSAGPALAARFRERAETRVHCSPPSEAVVHAAARALALNRAAGDRLRLRLLDRVRRFRRRLAEQGIAARGGDFPVQTLHTADASAALELDRGVRRRGVRAVLLSPPRGGGGPRLCFLITAAHTPRDIDLAAAALVAAARDLERSRSWTPTSALAGTAS
jgi:8-amino-7-oxononanoate synthase